MIDPAVLCAVPERLFTARAGMGIVNASPLQRAILRVLGGQPIGDVMDEQVARAFGCSSEHVALKPYEMSILSGKRAGKTAIIATMAICWSQTVDTTPLMQGERFRVPIVSLSRDLAHQAFHHTLGAIHASPVLRKLLVRPPTRQLIELMHPSGHVCEIAVTAGARAGASVAARYLGGAIFDEFPRMLGAGEGVVNWDDMRGECTGRVLDGGGILNAGTPWAPYGPAYQQFVGHWGRPSGSLCVVKAPAPWMNPYWWTHERCTQYRRDYPDRYVTDVDAEFSAQEESLFTVRELDIATRSGPMQLPPDDAADYSAAMDPATRGNAWTLVLVTRTGKKKRVALAKQWIGSRADPLSPRVTLAAIADELSPYRVRTIYTDQYSVDALRELARDVGLTLIPIYMTDKERTERFQALRLRMAEHQIEIPPDPVLRADLQRLRKRVTHAGVTILLPQTTDGRHCDYAPALILALRKYLDDVVQPPPKPGTKEYLAAEEARVRQAFDQHRRDAERARLMGVT